MYFGGGIEAEPINKLNTNQANGINKANFTIVQTTAKAKKKQILDITSVITQR